MGYIIIINCYLNKSIFYLGIPSKEHVSLQQRPFWEWNGNRANMRTRLLSPIKITDCNLLYELKKISVYFDE